MIKPGEIQNHDMDAGFYIDEFKAKCENKGINPSGFHAILEQRLPQYKKRWEKSMTDQIKNLPEFRMVLREVMRHLRGMEF